MKRFLRPLHPVLSLIILLGSVVTVPAEEATPAPVSDLEQKAFEIGTEAYVYGLPLVKLYLLRQRHLETTTVNKLVVRDEPMEPEAAQFIAPNEEVLYSGAWLDLSNGPVVLSLPHSEGRYFSFQAVEMYGDNQVYASTRTHANDLLRYAYIPPHWKGDLPPGIQRIDCYSTSLLLIGRTYFASAADIGAARMLQHRYRLQSLDGNQPTQAIQYPQFDPAEPLSFYAILDEGLRQNPPPRRITKPAKRFRELGIGGEQPLDLATLDPAIRRGLTRALEAGRQQVETCRQQLTRKTNGWRYPPWHIGLMGTNYCERAAIASLHTGFNSPAECLYMACREDANGQPLHSKNTYRLQFPKGELPPAYAFWSLTVYHWPELTVAANDLNRLSLRSTNPALQFAADGSLEIHLGPDSPGADRESNWLPTPEGEFQVVLRVYNPHLQPVRSGWTPPLVELVE